MHTYIKGMFHSTRTSGNFDLKLSWMYRLSPNWKSFEKASTSLDTRLAIQTTMNQGAADNIRHLDGKTKYSRPAWNKIFNFSRLDWFNHNWTFQSTFSTHCRYQYLIVSYFPSVLLIHPCCTGSNNSYIAVLCSVWFGCQMIYFSRDFQIFFGYSKVVFEDLWTQSAKIWKQSAQN